MHCVLLQARPVAGAGMVGGLGGVGSGRGIKGRGRDWWGMSVKELFRSGRALTPQGSTARGRWWRGGSGNWHAVEGAEGGEPLPPPTPVSFFVEP